MAHYQYQEQAHRYAHHHHHHNYNLHHQAAAAANFASSQQQQADQQLAQTQHQTFWSHSEISAPSESYPTGSYSSLGPNVACQHQEAYFSAAAAYNNAQTNQQLWSFNQTTDNLQEIQQLQVQSQSQEPSITRSDFRGDLTYQQQQQQQQQMPVSTNLLIVGGEGAGSRLKEHQKLNLIEPNEDCNQDVKNQSNEAERRNQQSTTVLTELSCKTIIASSSSPSSSSTATAILVSPQTTTTTSDSISDQRSFSRGKLELDDPDENYQPISDSLKKRKRNRSINARRPAHPTSSTVDNHHNNSENSGEGIYQNNSAQLSSTNFHDSYAHHRSSCGGGGGGGGCRGVGGGTELYEPTSSSTIVSLESPSTNNQEYLSPVDHLAGGQRTTTTTTSPFVYGEQESTGNYPNYQQSAESYTQQNLYQTISDYRKNVQADDNNDNDNDDDELDEEEQQDSLGKNRLRKQPSATTNSSEFNQQRILEMRKEKSRDAARSRRSKENHEFYELAKLLPLPAAITSQLDFLDKASIIRLTISFLKLRQFSVNGHPAWAPNFTTPGSVNPYSSQSICGGQSQYLQATNSTTTSEHYVEGTGSRPASTTISNGHQLEQQIGRQLFNSNQQLQQQQIPSSRESGITGYQTNPISGSKQLSGKQSSIANLFDIHQGTHILQSLDGFAFAIGRDGRFLYISETVSMYLGLSQVEMTGSSVFDYTHQQDHEELARALGISYNNQTTASSSNNLNPDLNMNSFNNNNGESPAPASEYSAASNETSIDDYMINSKNVGAKKRLTAKQINKRSINNNNNNPASNKQIKLEHLQHQLSVGSAPSTSDTKQHLVDIGILKNSSNSSSHQEHLITNKDDCTKSRLLKSSAQDNDGDRDGDRDRVSLANQELEDEDNNRKNLQQDPMVRQFCIRMKSTLTKRGCQHFKSSGYRVVHVVARLRSYQSNDNGHLMDPLDENQPTTNIPNQQATTSSSSPTVATGKQTSKGRGPKIGNSSKGAQDLTPEVAATKQQQQQQSDIKKGGAEQKIIGMVAVAIALPPPSINELRLESDTFVFRLGLDLRVTHIEPKITELLHYPIEAIAGKSLYSLVHPADLRHLQAYHRDLLRKGQMMSGYYRLLTCDGGHIWIQTCATVICNNSPQASLIPAGQSPSMTPSTTTSIFNDNQNNGGQQFHKLAGSYANNSPLTSENNTKLMSPGISANNCYQSSLTTTTTTSNEIGTILTDQDQCVIFVNYMITNIVDKGEIVDICQSSQYIATTASSSTSATGSLMQTTSTPLHFSASPKAPAFLSDLNGSSTPTISLARLESQPKKVPNGGSLSNGQTRRANKTKQSNNNNNNIYPNQQHIQQQQPENGQFDYHQRINKAENYSSTISTDNIQQQQQQHLNNHADNMYNYQTGSVNLSLASSKSNLATNWLHQPNAYNNHDLYSAAVATAASTGSVSTNGNASGAAAAHQHHNLQQHQQHQQTVMNRNNIYGKLVESATGYNQQRQHQAVVAAVYPAAAAAALVNYPTASGTGSNSWDNAVASLTTHQQQQHDQQLHVQHHIQDNQQHQLHQHQAQHLEQQSQDQFMNHSLYGQAHMEHHHNQQQHSIGITNNHHQQSAAAAATAVAAAAAAVATTANHHRHHHHHTSATATAANSYYNYYGYYGNKFI